MTGIRVKAGRLEKGSRLYRHLTERHRARAMGLGSHPEIRLEALGGSHEVFLLKDSDTGREYVLKSYYEEDTAWEDLRKHLDSEYDCLKHVRKIGVDSRHCRIVKPLCRDREGLFMVEEHVNGTDLSHYISDALGHGGHGNGQLYEKLDLLAGFLGRLHARTATSGTVHASSIARELDRHARESYEAGAMNKDMLREIRKLARKWCSDRSIKGAKVSLTHGDVTPSNFIYSRDRVFAIDMERSRYRDPIYDLGLIAGELLGSAMARSGDPRKADPYIGHIFWKYAGRFNDQFGTFLRLTKRNPLYMANSLLRMARNPYHPGEHKRRLAAHALECLRSPLPDRAS